MESKHLKEKREKIVKGLELAYTRLIAYKKMKNTPLIVSKNGKVVELDPDQASPTTTYKWN